MVGSETQKRDSLQVDNRSHTELDIANAVSSFRTAIIKKEQNAMGVGSILSFLTL